MAKKQKTVAYRIMLRTKRGALLDSGVRVAGDCGEHVTVKYALGQVFACMRKSKVAVEDVATIESKVE